MRKKIFTIIILLIIISLPVAKVFTNASQPPAGRTGCTIGSTETTCGTASCHNNTPNTGSGSLIVTFSDTALKYIPGQTYDMTVTTTEVAMVKFGFEITSVDPNGDSVGTFIIPGGTINLSAPPGGINHRKYLAHKTSSSNNTWSFQWKAPAIDKGQLCFFVASNCANGNGHSTGDHIYTTSICITADNVNGISSMQTTENAFTIGSISNNQIIVNYHQATNDLVLFRLYDLNGQLIQTLLNENEPQGLQTHSFVLKHTLVNGLYILRYSSAGVDESRKIFIQK